jgi:hypothetical protein
MGVAARGVGGGVGRCRWHGQVLLPVNGVPLLLSSVFASTAQEQWHTRGNGLKPSAGLSRGGPQRERCGSFRGVAVWFLLLEDSAGVAQALVQPVQLMI